MASELRHKGIGALLVRAAESEASSLGVQWLYLYTPASQGYYGHLGWSLIEHCQLPSGSVAVMGKELQPNIAVKRDAPNARPLP